MGEELRHSFLVLLAKRAKVAIIPSSPLKAIHRPNPILDSQPSEELDI
jgi:hypothetical protein